jgi:uncharacterized membrane protein
MSAPTLASLIVGPVQFDQPMWLILIPILWALVVWIGRSSLSGLGTVSRRAALVVRLLVVALFVLAMAEPQIRDVARDVAVTVVTDTSKSIPPELQGEADRWVQRAAESGMKDDDRLGIVTVAVDAFVQSLPSKRNRIVEKNNIGATEGTDLAGGLRLALAVKQPDAAYRILLISDGNETVGSILRVAEAAKASGIPVDVLPLTYSNTREVIVEDFVGPATARMGENLTLKVRVTATAASSGRIAVTDNGEQLDLDPDSEALGAPVTLAPGTHWLAVPITVARAGPHEFVATFEPDSDAQGTLDTVLENNRAAAVTFVGGEGRVLVLAENQDDVAALESALVQAKIAAEVMAPDASPQSLVELSGYDAVVLCNVPAYSFSEAQMENLRQYVHDGGGGLVMIGGSDSLGAGGWIGTPVEDALPVKLDPPQKRQMPRGALVMVMHSVEMGNGMYWGKKTAEAAVDGLTRLDLAGIVEFSGWSRGGNGAADSTWVHPLSEVGDKVVIKQAINNMQYGDMPSFDGPLGSALQALQQAEAGLKHVIIISDGDPSLSPNLLGQFKKAKITITTVAFFSHNAADANRMRYIAEETDGRFWDIKPGQESQIPKIVFKDAQTIRRPLIWEGDPFQPIVTGAVAEPMRGVSAVPPITGYVVAAEREGLSMVTLRGKENDPIGAIWQYGLGRSVVFASSAATQWAGPWTTWSGFAPFWEAHMRWVMRPSGSANAKVVTVPSGDQTRVIVELSDAEGERLNFANMTARVARPDGTGEAVELKQVGPGRYEGSFKSDTPGSYMVSAKYAVPRPGGQAVEGTVQASVSRPFADEFRALKDNAALLRTVAAMTGGEELSGDPLSADLWRREGLEMPVAMRPIWLAVAMAAIGLFLLDVAVRRVRIDVPAMGRAVARSLGKSKDRAGVQATNLRAAREQARQRIEGGRAEAPEAGTPDRASGPGPDATASGAKFEASPEQMASRSSPVALGGEEERKPAPPKPGAPKASEEEGMSRLMKAKKRAKDEFDDQGGKKD